MRNVQVVLFTKKHQTFASLAMDVPGSLYLSWGRLRVHKKMYGPLRLWVKREGFFALNLRPLVLIRVHYG
jgi:hypothetical protein